MRKVMTALGLALALAIPAAAEEVVNFKDGRSMPVRSHHIEAGMVHVDLGDNDSLAFPVESIDSIVVAGKNVMLKTSYGSNGARRVPTTAGAYATGAPERPPVREIIEEENNRPSPIEIDEQTGMAVYRPMGKHPASNRRRFAVTGNMKVLADNPTRRGDGESTYGGTTPMGTRHVIGGIEPRRSNAARQPNAPRPVSLGLRDVYGGPAPENAEPAGREKKSK